MVDESNATVKPMVLVLCTELPSPVGSQSSAVLWEGETTDYYVCVEINDAVKVAEIVVC